MGRVACHGGDALSRPHKGGTKGWPCLIRSWAGDVFGMPAGRCDGLRVTQREQWPCLEKGPGTARKAAEPFAGGGRLLVSAQYSRWHL